MDNLKRLIVEHEDWLIDRVVQYAHQHDYTRYTSTLREAWRASIVGLSRPLVDALEEIPPGSGPAGGPIKAAVDFGIEEARKHRSRGIDLALFLGLMKFYRQAYFDLVEEKVTVLEDRLRLSAMLLAMFDSVELGMVREWSNAQRDTERDRLNAQTRELTNEKNKYLTVFESIAEPTILLDPDDAPVNINAAGGRIFLGDTSPGATYYGNRGPDRLRLLVDKILAHAAPGAEDDDRITLETALGPRTFSIAIQEMLDISRKFAGRVIILKDVTDYLAAIKAAEDANRAKSAFLATVSHEIKTPITSIIGLTGLIDDGRLSAQHQRYVGSIRASGKLLSELVENILGLSRAEANALQRVDQDFDLCELIEELMPIVGPDARAHGLQTLIEIAPEVQCWVRGDAPKLRHVLMNLLSNALKFTETGGVTIRVSNAAGATDGVPVVRFEVADTGVGLPAGNIDWLFDPFTQYAHPRLGTGTRGTGLGLAICRRLVMFLGGTISARPGTPAGSVFTFELPFPEARGPQISEHAETRLAVLVVEDDPVNALVAEGHLVELGHAPVVVHSYAAALQALENERFDLVLTDNRLDEATGLDLALHLRRAAEPRLKTLPVIVVTAAIPDISDKPAGTVQVFVEKPFDRHDLARAIRHSMAAKEAGRGGSTGVRTAPEPDESEGKPDHHAAPLLETHVLNQLLTDLGVERCGRIVESYLENAPRLAQAIANGAAAGDLAAISEAAHKLISAASFVGLTSVALRARDLHRSCAARDIRQTRAIQTDLQGLSRHATEALAAHWKQAIESYGLQS